jgi:hypothetical protein
MARDSELEEERAAELGYRTAGAREVALRDWFSVQVEGEKAGDFEKLVNRLRVKKWTKANPERKKQHARRYYHSSPEIGRRQTARARQRRLERHRAKPPVSCASCGVLFCNVHPKRGIQRRYCTNACEARAHQAAARRAAGRRATRCGRCRGLGHNTRTCADGIS